MSWDSAVPANSVTVASLPGHIRAVKSGILDEDNMASDSATDVASQQSIKAYVDTGTVTMTNKTLTSVAVDGTGVTLAAGADLIGSATSDITINNNKFTVAGDTGNTVIAGTCVVSGTLDVTGNIDPTTYETTNGGFLDEDAMGSDADNKVASQQSIKAYIDSQIALSVYQAPQTDDDEAVTLAAGTIYQAATDGIVTVWTAENSNVSKDVLGLVGASNPPTTQLQKNEQNTTQSTGLVIGFPVLKNYYWKIETTNTGTATIHWTPTSAGSVAPITP